MLPARFDNVLLGAKDRLALRKAGKNPDRTEADVDADNEPINTDLDTPMID